jgi:hypothetical protein
MSTPKSRYVVGPDVDLDSEVVLDSTGGESPRRGL